jgi:arginine:agmatine antiporter
MIRNRRIGLFLATMLVANNMIGSGIFLLPATLAAVGSITIIGWLIATLGAALIAVVLAKLAQIAPQPGGPAAYAGIALGPYMGFQANFIYWICCWIGNIAIAIAAIGYLASLFPTLGVPIYGTLATIGIIWLVTIVNVFGPRLACQFESLTLLAGLVPIVLVATAGWAHFDPQIFRESWNIQGEPPLRVIPDSLVLVFWAFVGLESASVATAVVEDPQRNVPLATLGGVLIAGLIYVASCSVIMGLLPATELAKSSAPFADAVALILGPIAGVLVAVMALIKATGTLCGWVLLTAQTGKASAERGLFPQAFARVDSAGIPVLNLIIMAGIMTIVVIATRSPTLGQQFAKLIEVSVVLCLLVYVYACTAVWHYAKSPSGAMRAKGYRMVAVASIVICLFVILRGGTSLLAISVLILSLTYPLYWFFKRSSRRSMVLTQVADNNSIPPRA